MNKRDLYKIIDTLIETRISKLVPMLVEHEVNRLIRENSTQSTHQVNKTPVSQSSTTQRGSLKEDYASLINGYSAPAIKGHSDESLSVSGNATIEHNSQIVRGHDGTPIDTSRPEISKIMNVINKDYSGMMKELNRKKSSSGYMPES